MSAVREDGEGHQTTFGTDQDLGLTSDLDQSSSNNPAEDEPNMVTLPSPTSGVPRELDFNALKAAISHFRVARMQASASNSGQSSPSPFISSANQGFNSDGDEISSPPPSSSTEHCGTNNVSSTLTLESLQEAVGQRQEESVSEVQTPGEAVRPTVDGPSTSQTRDRASSVEQNPSEAAAPRTSNLVDVDSTTESLNNTQSDASKSDQSEMPADPRSGAQESRDKSRTVGATKNPSSCTTQRIDNVITGRKSTYRSSAGLIPTPRNLTYTVGNPFLRMDLLQQSNLWAAAQRSVGAGLVANSVGMVQPAAAPGLPLGSNLNMAWNSLAQGNTPNMLGMPQLGQVQYIPGYAWHGPPGNMYPPRRGGNSGW